MFPSQLNLGSKCNVKDTQSLNFIIANFYYCQLAVALAVQILF